MVRRIAIPRATPADPDASGVSPDSDERIAEAAAALRDGGVVAIPTETVYGLAVASNHPGAVARLEEVKARPAHKPFSHHIAGAEDLAALVADVPAHAQTLADRYWPGPLTLILPARAEAGAGGESGAREATVGVRVPADDLARRIIRAAGVSLLVPSANPSGEAPATTADEVEAYFGDRIDLIVDGGPSTLKQSSTVVRVTADGFHTLREGIITRADVHQLIEGRRILFVCTGNTCRSPLAAGLYRAELARKLGKAPEDLEELGYQIGSAGTFAGAWGHPSEHSITIVRERTGQDISRQQTQPVTPDLLAESDRVYALGPSHLAVLESLAPELADRFAQLDEDGVPDPVGGDLGLYRECADTIERAIERILSRWS